MRVLRAIAMLAAALTVPVVPAAAAAPERVVSMNVCTDQLAMLISGKGQLHSVSALSTDPAVSVMVEEASGYAVNHGRAEEIHIMRPDLVLAGTHTTRTTVDMLKRLGIPVAEFALPTSLADIRENVLRMGEILGREERARQIVEEFDRTLAQLQTSRTHGTVAIYEPNSYASGHGTLAHAVVEAAGLDNIADDIGLEGTAILPLEVLVLNAPDLLVSSGLGAGDKVRATQAFRHPAFRAIRGRSRMVDAATRYWACGGPSTLVALRLMREAADALEKERQAPSGQAN